MMEDRNISYSIEAEMNAINSSGGFPRLEEFLL